MLLRSLTQGSIFLYILLFFKEINSNREVRVPKEKPSLQVTTPRGQLRTSRLYIPFLGYSNPSVLPETQDILPVRGLHLRPSHGNLQLHLPSQSDARRISHWTSKRQKPRNSHIILSWCEGTFQVRFHSDTKKGKSAQTPSSSQIQFNFIKYFGIEKKIFTNNLSESCRYFSYTLIQTLKPSHIHQGSGFMR